MVMVMTIMCMGFGYFAKCKRDKLCVSVFLPHKPQFKYSAHMNNAITDISPLAFVELMVQPIAALHQHFYNALLLLFADTLEGLSHPNG